MDSAAWHNSKECRLPTGNQHGIKRKADFSKSLINKNSGKGELELYVGKLTCTVLRRERGGNPSDLAGENGMQRIVFIRHSEPDYSFVTERKYQGHGLDLAQLTENGIQIAENASCDSRLNNAEIIVSSPYTRALQTAAIISKNRQLDIKIELGLHEWMPDLSFQYSSKAEASQADKLCLEYNGVCPDDSEIRFENFENVFNRAKNALLRYDKYKKIIVVTHQIVIRRFVFTPDIAFCGISEIDFDESFSCAEFKFY